MSAPEPVHAITSRPVWPFRYVTRILALCVFAASVGTYFMLTHATSETGPDPRQVMALLLVDLVLVLLLSASIGLRLARLWLARRQGSVGSRLQTRVLLWFGIVAVAPAIIIAGFSIFFFNFGIQSWFHTRVSTALEASQAVAEGYLREHKNAIEADVLIVANEVNRNAERFQQDADQFRAALHALAAVRQLTEASVFRLEDTEYNPEQTMVTLPLGERRLQLPSDLMQRAKQGELVVMKTDKDDRVRALLRLHRLDNTYLVVGRNVDPQVLGHMQQAQGSFKAYRTLQEGIGQLQIRFTFIFMAAALLVLLTALWAGMLFTGELVTPITALVHATRKVEEGRLDTRVTPGPEDDEIGTLGRAFNRMTSELSAQQEHLKEAHAQADARRRLLEAVFSGVSAGVLVLGRTRQVTLYNRSAADMLARKDRKLEGANIQDLLPDTSALLDQSHATGRPLHSKMELAHAGRTRTFNIHVVPEMFVGEIEGYIVTLDDITDLLAAQKTAAWSDVARRIAHEVKNPLTPIHLASTRIQQKYRDFVPSKEQEGFDRYTETIMRQVTRVRHMIDAFSQFARMPAPEKTSMDVVKTVKQTVFAQQVVYPHITYDLHLPEKPLPLHADANQLEQVVMNILKNAAEALLESDPLPEQAPCIHIRMAPKQHGVEITFTDNGPGFPDAILHQATEPYVTTREHGTGLGLAIVQKIISDHGGTITLANQTDPKSRGARITLWLPLEPPITT